VSDPYAPPKAEAAGEPEIGKDSADLFIDTLPSPALRATGVVWLVLGLLSLFLGLRMLLSLRESSVAAALEAGQVALGISAFAVGSALMRGRPFAALVGFALSPFAFGLSLFALVTGSLAGLFGLGIALLAVVLTAVTLKEVAKVGRARRALAAVKS